MNMEFIDTIAQMYPYFIMFYFGMLLEAVKEDGGIFMQVFRLLFIVIASILWPLLIIFGLLKPLYLMAKHSKN